MAAEGIANPILNSPYDPPARHFELSSTGPTGEIIESRRESESFIPVPPPKKGQKNQQSFDLDVSGERRQKNDLINEIRYQVGLWRGRGYPNVTPISRKLLHCTGPTRAERTVSCSASARRSKLRSS